VDLMLMSLGLLRARQSFSLVAEAIPERAWPDNEGRAVFRAAKQIYDADSEKKAIGLEEVQTMLDALYFGRHNKTDERDRAKLLAENAWNAIPNIDDTVLQETLRKVKHVTAAQDIAGQMLKVINANGEIDPMALLKRLEGLNGRDDHPESYIQMGPRDIGRLRLPTFLPGVDHFIAGGLEPGDLGVVVASPGFGKTRTLVHLAGRALGLGRKKVLFSTLELSATGVQERFDLHFRRGEANTTWNHIQRAFSEGVRLDIRDYSNEGCTVGNLRTLVERAAARGVKYDMICLDHLNLIIPKAVGQGDASEMYTAYGNIAADLRKIAQDFELVLWTAAIASREGHKKMLDGGIIESGDIGESFRIAYVSDVILSVNQTLRDREEGLVRMHLAKNRKSHHHPAPIAMRVNDQRMAYEAL
jgi:hypothetical protein